MKEIERYKTRGGKHEIVVSERDDGTRDVRQLTNGRTTASAVGYSKEESEQLLNRIIYYAKLYDKINYQKV